MKMRHKITLILLAFSLVPLAISGVAAYKMEEKLIRQNLGTIFQERAEETIDKVDRYLAEVFRDVSVWSNLTIMQEVVTGDLDNKITSFLILVSKEYRYFASLDVLDQKGEVVASSNPDFVGADLKEKEFFKKAMLGKSFIQDIYFSDKNQDWVIGFSIPIKAKFENKKVIGVLSAEKKATELLELMQNLEGAGGMSPENQTWLLRGDGLVISAPPQYKAFLFEHNLKEEGFELPFLSNQDRAGYATGENKNRTKYLIGYHQSVGTGDFSGLGWYSLVMQDVKKAYLPITRLKNIVLEVGCSISLVIVVFSLAAARQIVHPIIEISKTANRVAQGDLTQRVKVKSSDEAGDLARTFNKMIESLQEAQSIAIQSEKMAMAGQLAFGVAHEVKNPLAILMQGVDYLKKYGKSGDEEVPQLLDYMTQAIKRADYVIKGLLELGRPETLVLKPEDVSEIVEKAILLIKRQLDTCRVQVIKNFTAVLPKTPVDQGKMLSLFVNLLSNAAEAMSSGGSITITTALQKLAEAGFQTGRRREDVFKAGQEVVTISIEDTGSGISEDALPHIFDPFFTTKRDKGGTGLGLAVAKNIAQIHRGTIEITNRKEGGARATVMLPIG